MKTINEYPLPCGFQERSAKEGNLIFLKKYLSGEKLLKSFIRGKKS